MAQLNDLLVLGKSNLLGDTSIFGAFNINGDVLIDGTLTVNEAALFKSSIEASGSATVGGAATIKGRLYANDGINLPNNKRITQAQKTGSNYTALVEWNWADKGSYSYYPQIGHHSNGDGGSGALILMYAPSNTSPWTAANNHLYLSSNQLRWNNLIVMDSSRNFYPTSNGTGSIGTSSYYWNNGFLKNLTISTALTLNGTTYLNGNLVWKPSINITCTPTAANQEFSIDVGSSSYTGSYFHIWSAVKSTSILTCYPDDLSVKLAGATSIAGALTASSTALIKGSTEIQNNVKITNGNLTIHRDSTKEANTPAKIIFSNKQTDTPVTTGVAFIAAYDDQDAYAYGQNLVIQGGSNLVIGAGESPSNFYNAVLTTSSSEGLYLTSDGSIYFYPNCDTIANRVGVILNASRAFYPETNNAGSLGTSSYRWANAYIGNLNASGTGTITGNTSIGGTLDVGSTLTVGSTTLLKNNLTVNGNIYINQTGGTGTGLALYGTSAPTTYGIYFGTTANFGKHGDVQSDWATYFGMNAVGTRGWVFRPGTTNVASISANGIGSFTGVGDGNAYMAFPKGGTLTIGSSGQKGYLTIVMPAGFSSTMVKFKVSVYNYVTGTSVDYIIGGYCYASDNKWYNPTAYCIGPRNSGLANLTINYGMSGSNPAIQIGAADTSWEYPNIAISDVYLGHARTYTNWAQSWTVSITTTAITSITQTVSNTYMGNFTGTDNKVAKFTSSGRTITNSNITDDGSTVTVGTKLVVQGNGSSYNEGIRILPASNGWSNIFFSADSTVNGTHDGGWLIGRRGAAGATAGVTGDFTIEEQSSSGANLTIHKDGGGATLQGIFKINGGLIVTGRAYGSGDDEGIVVTPASNNYAGITLGSASAARTTLYLFPTTATHRSVWRYNNGTTTYDITHPETSGEIVVHTADTAQGSATLPVYVNASGVVTACTASSVFSALSWTAGTSAGPVLNVTVAGQTRTATIPSASASASGIVTTAAQTFAGAKTFNGNIVLGSSSYHVQRAGISTSWYLGRSVALIKTTSYSGYDAIWSMKTTNGDWSQGVFSNDILYWTYFTDTNFNNATNSPTTQMSLTSAGVLTATKIYGAVWNDYAEYRKSKELKPGKCIVETGKGDLVLSTKRLQPGANIVSDTYGFAIGETNECKTPIAVSGRVLVYPYEDKYSYKPGDAVCSGPNGTVSKMTREEIREYPERIIGTISEIPEYDTWGTGNVEVNGRIWIKIK